MSRLPDFFIIGAPKCGTTALHRYLSEHSRVFVPAFKEPHFFASDIRSPFYIRSWEQYLALFDGAGEEHLAVGEASVWYLFSQVAAMRIRELIPNARFIVMVRHPVDLFLSFHNQALASLIEDETDPQVAWLLQEERLLGKRIPEFCDEPRLLQYRDVCALGSQLERLFEIIPRSAVHVIKFDELAVDPRNVYQRVLSFLDLPDDGRSEFPRVNEAHRLRWPWMERARHNLDRRWLASRGMKGLLRPAEMPLRRLSRALRNRNVRRFTRSKISSSFRSQLADQFSREIEILSSLLDLDLSDWKKSPSQSTRYS